MSTAQGDRTTPDPSATRAPGLAEVQRIRPWWEPGLAMSGFDPGGRYVERHWLPVLGPTALVLLRHMAWRLRELPEGFTVPSAELARCVGVGTGRGRHQALARSLDRLRYFELARDTPGGLEVRTHVPALPTRHVRRLPDALQWSHDQWLLGPGDT